MRPRVTIGDFSRASHLSVKTLRHYHEVGLLEPSEVDPGNGYRYYAEDQIPLAQVIRRLRGLQMPVAEVKSVLAAPDPEARNRLIVCASRSSRGRPGPDPGCRRRATRAAGAAGNAARRGASNRAADLSDRDPGRRSIERTCSPGGRVRWESSTRSSAPKACEPAGPPAGMYASEIFQHGRGEATVFIPTGGAARAVGRVERLVVPPAELAIMLHRGSLADADLTYGELGAHVMRHEISVEGPLREYYLIGFLDTDDPDQWETEIGWPIFRSAS